MAKAASTSTTAPTGEPGKTVVPLRVQYTPRELEVDCGELVQLTMSATVLLHLVNMATATINARTMRFIHEVSSPPLAANH